MNHLKIGFAAAVALLSTLAFAQSASTPQPFVEQQRQQERERALREQNERTVDQRLQAAPPAPVARIPETEAPCFRIERVQLVGDEAEAFQWVVSDLSGPGGNDSPLSRCLGTAGVNVVLARAQQAAIARGFVTTRVLAAPQDLSTGNPDPFAGARAHRGHPHHARFLGHAGTHDHRDGPACAGLAAGNAALQGGSVDLSAGQTSAANIAITATQGDVITSKATVVTPGISAHRR